MHVTGNTSQKQPLPDGDSISAAKRARSGTEENKTVIFTNSTGETFTVELSPGQRIKGFCPICYGNKITAYPACRIVDRHVVCGVCIASLNLCPICNSKDSVIDFRMFVSVIENYKLELECTEFSCNKCSYSMSFSEAKTHSHGLLMRLRSYKNIPSEEPFSHRPDFEDLLRRNRRSDIPLDMAMGNYGRFSPGIASNFLLDAFKKEAEEIRQTMLWTFHPAGKHIPSIYSGHMDYGYMKDICKLDFRYWEFSGISFVFHSTGGTLSSMAVEDFLSNSLTQSAKRVYPCTEADKKNKEEAVKFTNGAGETFTVKLFPGQRIKGCCPVCRKDKLTVYPACNIIDRHVVCGTCIATMLKNTEKSPCPICNRNGGIIEDIHIASVLHNYKLELENTEFKCDKCPDKMGFSEAKTHCHGSWMILRSNKNIPSEEPFCYKPDIGHSLCRSHINDGQLDKIVKNIVSQIKRDAPGVLSNPGYFLHVLNNKSSEIIPLILRVFYPDYVHQSVRSRPISSGMLEVILKVCFRCRAFSENPLTLACFREALLMVGERSLSSSLTWPDE